MECLKWQVSVNLAPTGLPMPCHVQRLSPEEVANGIGRSPQPSTASWLSDISSHFIPHQSWDMNAQSSIILSPQPLGHSPFLHANNAPVKKMLSYLTQAGDERNDNSNLSDSLIKARPEFMLPEQKEAP